MQPKDDWIYAYIRTPTKIVYKKSIINILATLIVCALYSAFCTKNAKRYFKKETNIVKERKPLHFMEQKRFTKNDQGFVCGHCGNEVLPLSVTSRNHCPFCLYSRHLDILPGDRQSDCMGLMKPVQALPDAKKGFIIIHKCEKCGFQGRNKAAIDVKVQPDNMDLIIKLTVAPQ